MKQHITLDQLNELTEEQRKSLMKWFGLTIIKETLEGRVGHTNKGLVELTPGGFPLLSIGQMIEFLDKNAIERFDGTYLEFEPDKGFYAGHFGIGWSDHNELCDALWESVKETL